MASAATTEPATTEPTTSPVEEVVPAQAVAEPGVVRAVAPVGATPRPVARVVAKPTILKPAAPKPTSEPTSKPATAKPTSEPTSKPATAKPATTPPTSKPAPASAGGCNVNYTPCVPNDPTDVDCQGGKGNGPSYVKGPVTVTGSDVYGLDADHDGVGCD